MHDAEVAAIVGYQKLGDGVLAHERERVNGQRVGADGFGGRVEDVAGANCAEIATALEHSAEVAIGNDAKQLVFVVDHGCSTKAFGADFEDDFVEGRFGVDDGSLVKRVEVLHPEVELFSKRTAGVEFCEVLRSEPFARKQGHSERIAECHLGGSAAGGGEVVGVGFLFDGGVKQVVGLTGEAALAIGGNGDKRVSKVLDEWGEDFDLRGFAAFGKADNKIGGLHHAKVAMNGIGGVEEKCGRTSGVERRGYFLRHDSTFANAGDNEAAAGCGSHIFHEPLKIKAVVKAFSQREQCLGFEADGAAGDVEDGRQCQRLGYWILRY